VAFDAFSVLSWVPRLNDVSLFNACDSMIWFFCS